MDISITLPTTVSTEITERHERESLPDSTQCKPELITEFKLIDLPDDDKFPSFFIDHSGLVSQFENWLTNVETREKYNTPRSPCIFIDPSKSGKTALLTRVAPMKINEKFPHALICQIDFIADIEIGSTDSAPSSHKNFVTNLCTVIKAFCKDNRLELPPAKCDYHTNETYLISIFEHLDSLKRKIFFLWDEVQVWFKEFVDGYCGGLFDKITFHKQFRHLNFCVSGSAMFSIFEKILDFPSRGDYWISAAFRISSDGSADTKALKNFTLKSFKEKYPDIYPSYLEDYVLDDSPAMISLIIEKHLNRPNTIEEVRKINREVAFELQTQFQQDLPNILKRLQNGNAHEKYIYLCITEIALGMFKIKDDLEIEDILGCWYLIFECLIEEKYQGFLNLKGYYGYILAMSLSINGLVIKPIHDTTYSVPSYFVTINLIQEMIDRLSKEERKKADKISQICLASESIGDWTSYGPYCYFYRQNIAEQLEENNMDKITVKMESETPYLYFFKCIRNTVSHISSPESLWETEIQVQPIYHDWLFQLFNFAKKM